MRKCPLTSFHLSLSLLASSFSLFIASSSTLERAANRPIGGHVFKAAEWNEVACEERRGGLAGTCQYLHDLADRAESLHLFYLWAYA